MWKELNFGEEEPRLCTEKLEISPTLNIKFSADFNTKRTEINVTHKGHSSGHFCKMTKEYECWERRNQQNTFWSLRLQTFVKSAPCLIIYFGMKTTRGATTNEITAF